MLGHPAFLAAEVGRNPQRETFLAQKNVAAVAGVYRNDGVVLREVADIPLFLVNIAFAVQSPDPVGAVAESLKYVLSYSGHDGHVQDHIDGVGNLNPVFRKRRADRAHRIRDYIHGPAAVAAPCDIVKHFIRLGRLHPVVGGACVLLFLRADEGAVLHPRDVVDRGAVEVTAGQLFLVQLNHLAGFAGFGAQGFKLFLRAIYPHNPVGLHQILLLLKP